jgi:hypothetical protein
MSNIPLVNNNSIDAINTSIIAIKKNLNNNDQIQDVDVNVGINIATNCTYCAASSTTIKGAQLYNGCSIKVLFTSAITGSDTTTPMSINYNDVSIPVKTGKNGVLSNFVANNIDGSYIYCQAYTTLELLFDGTQFIIMGNPVVISSADYTIYTDGSKTYLNDGWSVRTVNNNLPKDLSTEHFFTFDVTKYQDCKLLGVSMYSNNLWYQVQDITDDYELYAYISSSTVAVRNFCKTTRFQGAVISMLVALRAR